MITLNVDVTTICELYDINTQKLRTQYSGMSIEEIMETEAKAGNTKAASFDSEILTNPTKLIELFKLDNVSNKYALLSNMNENDLDNMLPYLQQDDLTTSLNYFNKDKVTSLITALPQDQLLNVTFQMFSPEQLMAQMPEEQLNNVLSSTDLDKNLVEKYLPTLAPQVLAQMLQGAGQQVQTEGNSVGLDGSANLNQDTLLTQMKSLSNDNWKTAMESMPPTNKQEFVLRLTNENQNLYNSIDASAYTKIMSNNKTKTDMVNATSVVDKDQLVKMVSQLPKDLTSVVLTQLDTTKFATLLQKNFKDILSQISLG